MKKRKFILPILSSLALIAVSTPLIVKASENNEEVEKEEIVYQTDFEGMTISASSTADINTGFVWVSNWQEAKTISRKGSNVLDCALANSSTYAPVGGFGIASNSNLSKCKTGEPYTCSCYLEFSGIDYLFVEFVGDSWGSVILYPDGSIKQNPGGNNMSHVFYENNQLEFTFTKQFHSEASVEGYIQFTGYNANNAHVYFDNIIIKRSKYVINEDYENMPVGSFDNNSDLFNKIYLESKKIRAEYVKESNNTVAKMTYSATSTESNPLFYLNKFAGMNKNRNYNVSFDYKTSNVSKTTLVYGGTFVNEINSFDIDENYNISNIQGDKISNIKYENGKLSFDLDSNVTFSEYTQFEFVGTAKEIKDATYTIDNVYISQLPTIESLSAIISQVKKTYYLGDELNTNNLSIIAYYTDNTSRTLNANEYQVSGYDKEVEGKQTITITYQGKKVTYKVNVLKKLVTLDIDTTNVKKEFNYGEEFNYDGLVVKATFEEKGQEELSHNAFLDGYSISYGGFDSRKPGTYTISITYRDQTKSYDVVVKERDRVTFDVTYKN